jgi:hypothetical protein
MHAVVHTLAAVVVVPYLGLALMFALIGQLAQTQGLWALIDAVVNHASWLMRWGLYGALLLWLGLLIVGWVPRWQRPASLCLGLLALVCLVVLVALPAARLGAGQLLFLLPCAAVAVVGVWLFLRAGAGA